MSDQSQANDNAVGARAQLSTASGTTYSYYRLQRLAELGMVESLERLPFTVRILLENVLRNLGGEFAEQAHLEGLAKWSASGGAPEPRELERGFRGRPLRASEVAGSGSRGRAQRGAPACSTWPGAPSTRAPQRQAQWRQAQWRQAQWR